MSVVLVSQTASVMIHEESETKVRFCLPLKLLRFQRGRKENTFYFFKYTKFIVFRIKAKAFMSYLFHPQ